PRPPPTISTLFPYTTLFRSDAMAESDAPRHRCPHRLVHQAAAIRDDRHVSRVRGRGSIESGASVRQREESQAVGPDDQRASTARSEEHTSELQSRSDLVCRL